MGRLVPGRSDRAPCSARGQPSLTPPVECWATLPTGSREPERRWPARSKPGGFGQPSSHWLLRPLSLPGPRFLFFARRSRRTPPQPSGLCPRAYVFLARCTPTERPPGGPPREARPLVQADMPATCRIGQTLCCRNIEPLKGFHYSSNVESHGPHTSSNRGRSNRSEPPAP